jgi:hypothetical protein
MMGIQEKTEIKKLMRSYDFFTYGANWYGNWETLLKS